MTEKQLYVVYFESANYCGAGEYVLVWATDEDDALSNFDLAIYAEDFYREQDQEQYNEEAGIDEDDEQCWDEGVQWANIVRAELLETSDHKKYALNPKPGCSVYQYMNTKD